MSVKEFQDFVSETLETHRKESKQISFPENFYYCGVRFGKDTPKEDWDWLEKEMENE